MRQVFHTFPWIHPDESPEIKGIYARYGHSHLIRKGEIVKSAYDTNRLFYLKKGLCAYYINFNVGKPRVLSLIVPGRVMGDITCITGERVNVTTRAMRDSELLVIPPQVLLQEMRVDVSHALLVTRSIIGKQESHLEGMIANFTLQPDERLRVFIKVLLLTYRRQVDEGWNEIPLTLSQEEYGEITHVTRVTVSRIFSRWRKNGWMSQQGRHLQVHSDLFSQLYDWVDAYQKR